MIKITDILGEKWRDIKLYDDNSVSYGGLSRAEETLGDFIDECNIDIETESVGYIQKQLKKCGIQEIEEVDRYIEEKLQQKIWDTEEELGIKIIDWHWDFKEIINDIN